ncbi:DUF4271 domain-containing protein [Flavobacteriaceae bacterium]|nr:DUF4271 domain-containing protein [Flavobacteriaceae bacterium]MDA9323379.1 DUF4271 domain-containing protein [Flavobacteriaceae bacterium]MDA9977785.1 DUF4271 domain-containing protein [Flavobacteriaceae bacterium]MDB4007170.1 DUF4271 domain-containing protein [Flavobacteriaceae bacterium]MDB4024102.1 DUF4271 domain-containing protein [Flavobacteriaceae bacterium]
MSELEIIDFPIQNWIKIIIVLGTVLILLSRLYIGERFQYLFSFWNIHRYFHYKSGETISLLTPNNVIMFFLRLLTTSLFILILFQNKYQAAQKEFFIKLIIGLSIIILLKFFTEKILSFLFRFKKKLKEINRFRIGIKNLFAVHLYCYLIIIIFSGISFDKIDNISLAIIILYNVFYLKFILNKYLIRGFKALVYFILYICTFEIIPVLGVLYLIK